MLYLAYGSNTNIQQMSNRCPMALNLGRYDLSNYRLVFREFADIVYSPGSITQCVLWEITKDCEKKLDRYEGYPFLYKKEYVRLDDLTYNNEYAMFYYMVDHDYTASPSIVYRDILVKGYIDNGLDIEQIYNAEGYDKYHDITVVSGIHPT